MLSAVKRRLLPGGAAYRTVKTGLCKGRSMPLDLQYQFRTFLGIYETEIRPSVREYARGCDCVYDVGANTGYYSLAFDRLGVRRICAFEPESEKLNLKKTLAVNKVRAEVEIFSCFVGDAVDTDACKISLDHVVYTMGRPRPRLIKMDIEGGELEALRGARRLLLEFSPGLIVEVHSRQLRADCRLFLEELGYAVRAIDQSAFLPRRQDEYNGWLCAKMK